MKLNIQDKLGSNKKTQISCTASILVTWCCFNTWRNYWRFFNSAIFQFIGFWVPSLKFYQGKASLKIILLLFLCKNKLLEKYFLKAEAEFQHVEVTYKKTILVLIYLFAGETWLNMTILLDFLLYFCKAVKMTFCVIECTSLAERSEEGLMIKNL